MTSLILFISVRCILGSGAFGTVYRGVWSHLSTDFVEEEEVAMKTIENGSSEEDRVKFLQEAAIMGQFNHPNIVKILGTIIDKNEVLYVCIDLVLAWTGLCVFQNARIAIVNRNSILP